MFKRFDPDMIGHYIEMAKEILDAVLGLAFICGGLIGLWFLGCALA